MTEGKLREEVRDYIRKQTQLNGGGFVSLNINNLVLGFAEILNKQLTEKDKQIEELEAENKRLKNEIIQKCYPEQMNIIKGVSN